MTRKTQQKRAPYEKVSSVAWKRHKETHQKKTSKSKRSGSKEREVYISTRGDLSKFPKRLLTG